MANLVNKKRGNNVRNPLVKQRNQARKAYREETGTKSQLKRWPL